jgi:hypothetical protein
LRTPRLTAHESPTLTTRVPCPFKAFERYLDPRRAVDHGAGCRHFRRPPRGWSGPHQRGAFTREPSRPAAGLPGLLFQFLREEKPPYHSSPKGEERKGQARMVATGALNHVYIWAFRRI